MSSYSTPMAPATDQLPARQYKEIMTLSVGERQFNALEKHTRLGGISKQEFMRRMIDRWIADGMPNV